jgi:hypothetical protein
MLLPCTLAAAAAAGSYIARTSYLLTVFMSINKKLTSGKKKENSGECANVNCFYVIRLPSANGTLKRGY